MRPVTQTRFYEGPEERGSCVQACIASIFELPESLAPVERDAHPAYPSGRLTPAQTVAVEHVCLLAEECAHPRFGHVLPLGTLNLTINAGYE